MNYPKGTPMKTVITALLAIFVSAAAPAQTAPSTQTPAPNTAATKDMAEAEIRKIDKDAKKVTLKHGPIKNLDMPSMTMVFQVRDATLFEKMVVGEKILFTAEQLQGAYVVTGVEKPPQK
jgi:Cu(I)/Ag(I) efflux system periplasmic protein CusF